MKKRLVCLLLGLLLLLSLCPASFAQAEAQPVNWYEIFVRSFCDSDGDGLGDLKGVAEKLDYIRSLGCTGIWLMPVMPSPSYHKYDVTDYYGIDPEYGTLEDMRALLDAAHARGMRIIVDMPFNHCSSLHPWFLSAAASGESPYRGWFNWSDTPRQGYSPSGEEFYESRFADSMPDLNLDELAVRAALEDIMRFWLADVGVDGFRLDAVTSFYTGRVEENVAFLNWLADTAHGLAPGCCLVGEAWEGLSSLARYCESRIDSFFTFPVSQAEGYIAKVLGGRGKQAGLKYAEYTALLDETLPAGTVPAPFLENHDTGRTVGFTGRENPDKTKMAGGLLCLLRGNVFLYYGQEIGMVGSGEDPNKRLGMLWTSEAETTLPPPGVTRIEYAYPSVEAQEADPASLLHYYRQALALRERFPAIARGTNAVLPSPSDDACLLLREQEGEAVLLAVNPSRTPVQLALEDCAPGFTVLAASLCTDPAQRASLDDANLTLPAYTIAVLTRQAVCTGVPLSGN